MKQNISLELIADHLKYEKESGMSVKNTYT